MAWGAFLYRRAALAGGEEGWRPAPFLVSVALVAVVLPSCVLVGLRLRTGPSTFVHDGCVAVEEAARMLLSGENPYAADFRETPMGQMPIFGDRPNPAWDHFVYYPALILITVPPYALSQAVLGWFDQRLLYLPLFLLCGVLAWKLGGDGGDRSALAAASVVMNPAFTFFVIQGRNDVVPLVCLLGGLLLLRHGRALAGGLSIGLGAATKQTLWLGVPFLAVHILQCSRRSGLVRSVSGALAVFLGAVVPFILWDWQAFKDDTIDYILGKSPTSYPVTGVSLFAWLVRVGVMSPGDAFPSMPLILLLGTPFLSWLAFRQWRRGSLGQVFWGTALFSALVLFLSRFFNDSYVAYLTVLCLMGYATREVMR